LRASAVVLATPAGVSSALVCGLDPPLAGTLGSIPYVSSATLSLAYRAADLGRPLRGYGYVVPRAEGTPVLACTWSSSKFEHRAPEGRALVRLFFGRAGQEEVAALPESKLVRLAREELRRTLGIDAEPILHRLFRWPAAMPQYNLGHPDRIRAIRSRLERHPGLFVCGAAYSGVGIPDCIASGRAAAEAAFDHVNEKHPVGDRPGV
jgi:oxygen-dependent protoporphyrinogen oxidase